MKEVDAALERIHGERGQHERSAATPPAPHWVRRAEPAPRARPWIEPSPPALDPTIDLNWPAVVLELERQWGDRFERLADALDQARLQAQARVVLFTSCHRAEGRTTLVLALARTLARRPEKTLIVDADLTGPMLARLLGLRPVVGLDDLVQSGASLSDAVVASREGRLSILPLRSAVAAPRDFLASPGWSCTMAKLRREYDLVLLDGGPLFIGLSAAVLHRSVDAAVLVRRPGSSGERAVVRAREVLEAGGVPLLGLAETFT